MGKDPAFLFYPGDWLGGTLTFSRAHKGAYMDLLMVQFNNGHMSIHDIKDVLGQDFETMWEQKLKSKFKTDDKGLFFNEKLEKEKLKRKAYVKNRHDNLNSHMDLHKGPHMDKHMENENENEDKKENKKEYSEFIKREAELWMNHILGCGYFKTAKPNIDRFMDEIDKLIRLDKIQESQLLSIRAYLESDVENNGFSWTHQIGSPGKLREYNKSKTRKYWESILIEINKNGKAPFKIPEGLWEK